MFLRFARFNVEQRLSVADGGKVRHVRFDHFSCSRCEHGYEKDAQFEVAENVSRADGVAYLRRRMILLRMAIEEDAGH